MLIHRRNSSGFVWFCSLLSIVAVLSAVSFAQEDQTPKQEIFTGYQYLHPGANVPSPAGTLNSPVPQNMPDMPAGLGLSYTYNFSQHLGLQADFGRNWKSGTDETTFSIGPQLEARHEGVVFFGNALLSYNRLTPPGLSSYNGIGAILGGGMGLQISKLITFRAFEADYVWGRQNFSNIVSPSFPDLRRVQLEGLRLRTGLVWNFGYPQTAAPAASCSVTPGEVMVGEPITVNVSGSNFNPKHTLTYSWASNGGKVAGSGTTANLDTNGVAGGSYTVTAHIVDAKMKTGGTASCSANFTVKEPPKNPPTMSCSASPADLQTGGSATISCTCTSPDNVPVTVSSWTSTGGSLSGSGNTATLSTSGAAAGTITASATCTDSRGLNAQASTQVTIENPPPPVVDKQLEARLALHSIYFATARPTPENPTGGLVASQEQTLTVLATDFQAYLKTKPDAHLILEGHADRRGTVEFNQALSQRRVDRTKNFLIEHGVPAENIDTKALGKQHNLTDAEVKASIENNPELSPEERTRILKNELVIIMASNRRVDVTLSTTGQSSVRTYPFNAADSLTLIGGRESEMKKKAPAPKKGQKKK